MELKNTYSIILNGKEHHFVYLNDKLIWQKQVPEQYTQLYSASWLDFDGTNYVDTGINIWGLGRGFTILCSFFIDSSATTSTNNPPTILHQMYEASPWPGLAIDYMYKGGRICPISVSGVSGVNQSIHANKNTDIKGGQVIVGISVTPEGVVNVSSYTDVGGARTMTGTTANSTSFGSDKLMGLTTILGAYQSTAGVKGRFFTGTIADCLIYEGAMSMEEMTEMVNQHKLDEWIWYDDDGTTVLDSNFKGEYSKELPTKPSTIYHTHEWYDHTGVELQKTEQQMEVYQFSEWEQIEATSFQATYSSSIQPEQVTPPTPPEYENEYYAEYTFNRWSPVTTEAKTQYLPQYDRSTFKGLLLYVGTRYHLSKGYLYSEDNIRALATKLGDTRLIINCDPNVSRWTFNSRSPFSRADIDTPTPWEFFGGGMDFETQKGYELTHFDNTALVEDAYVDYLPFAIDLAKKLLQYNSNLKLWFTLPISVNYFTAFAHMSLPYFIEFCDRIMIEEPNIWEHIEGFYYNAEGGFEWWSGSGWDDSDPIETNSSMNCMAQFKNYLNLQGYNKKTMCIPFLATATQNKSRIISAYNSQVFDYVIVPASYNFSWANTALRDHYTWINEQVHSIHIGYELEWDGSTAESRNRYYETVHYLQDCQTQGPMVAYIDARSGSNFTTDLQVYKDFWNMEE